MEEMVVTRLWMAGVVGMMLIFAIISIVGYLRKKGASRTAPATTDTATPSSPAAVPRG